MILQREFKAFKLKNVNPTPSESHKYDYQLYRNNRLVMNQLSNDTYLWCKITIIGSQVSADLVWSTKAPNLRDIEDPNVFYVAVKNNS